MEFDFNICVVVLVDGDARWGVLRCSLWERENKNAILHAGFDFVRLRVESEANRSPRNVLAYLGAPG